MASSYQNELLRNPAQTVRRLHKEGYNAPSFVWKGVLDAVGFRQKDSALRNRKVFNQLLDAGLAETVSGVITRNVRNQGATDEEARQIHDSKRISTDDTNFSGRAPYDCTVQYSYGSLSNPFGTTPHQH